MNKYSPLVKLVTDIWTPQKFRIDFEVIYNGQVPNIGILLISGKIKLITNKMTREVNTCTFIALQELITRTPIEPTVTLCQNAQVSTFDRIALFQTAKDHLLISDLIKNI